ncbi:MAG: 4Fe-4S binding protein [Bdellovibrionales bacterium]|nr:4Fe-4S binding protein [Bdellovibrionales bacterium]
MSHIFLEISSICIACDNCRLVCPENAVITNGTDYAIDPWSCTLCGLCIEVCPVDCIKESKPI